MDKRSYALILANHWSFTGIGWQLGIESCRNSIEESLDLADKPPHLKVCINLDARAYEAVGKYYPETIERLKKYLKEGKTEIIGGTYGQPMGSMVGNESVIRQITEGRECIQNLLDYGMISFLEEEEFTFPQLPQILNKTGFKYASLAQCDTWGKTGSPEMKYSRIKWQGRDGSKIPATPRTKLYFHPPVVTKDVNALLEDEYREKIEEVSKYVDYPVVTAWTEFGWEPPSEHNINKFYAENYQNLSATDDVKFLTLSGYLSEYSKEDDPTVFVSYDDFKKLLPWGVGGDQLRRYDRNIEKEILFTERLDALLYSLGEESLNDEIKKAWQDLLIAQSHDVSLCEYSRWGGGVMPPEEVAEDYYNMQWGAIGYNHIDSAKKQISSVKNALLKKLSKYTSSCEGSNKTLGIVNMTERAFCGDVFTQRVNFTRDDKVTEFNVVDEKGKPVAFDILESARYEDGTYRYVKLCINVKNLPPMSIAKVKLVEGRANSEETLCVKTEDKFILKNKNLVAEIDKKKGWLTSLICAETGEKVLSGDNLIFNGQPSHDYPKWAIDVKLPYFNLGEDTTVKVSLKENGQTVAKIDCEFIHSQYKFTVSYTLTKDAVGLDVKCRIIIHLPPQAAEGNINGWQLPLEITDGYWLDFKPCIENPEYIVDAPFEVVKTDKDAFHASTFVEVKGENTSLMIVHGGNQYFKLSDRGLSNLLLREWESHFTARCDWQVYTQYGYTLIPHKTTECFSEMIDLSRVRDEKPVVCEIDAQCGQNTLNTAKFNLKGAKLSSLRATEEGIELRIFNPSNEQTEISASLPFAISKAYKTDMIGNKLNTVSVLEGKISDSLTPWEIATYFIEF